MSSAPAGKSTQTPSTMAAWADLCSTIPTEDLCCFHWSASVGQLRLNCHVPAGLAICRSADSEVNYVAAVGSPLFLLKTEVDPRCDAPLDPLRSAQLTPYSAALLSFSSKAGFKPRSDAPLDPLFSAILWLSSLSPQKRGLGPVVMRHLTPYFGTLESLFCGSPFFLLKAGFKPPIFCSLESLFCASPL